MFHITECLFLKPVTCIECNVEKNVFYSFILFHSFISITFEFGTKNKRQATIASNKFVSFQQSSEKYENYEVNRETNYSFLS